MKQFERAFRGALFVILVLVVGAGAQPVPLDLTDSVDLSPFSMEEILGTLVVAPEPSDESDVMPTLVPKQRWNLQYRYAHARYEEYQDRERKNLSHQDVLELYPVVHTLTLQEAHSVAAKTEVGKGWQVGVLLSYIRQSTDHIRRQGSPFTLDSEGLGDTELSLGKNFRHGPHVWAADLSASLPTGSIDEKGETPRGPGTQLPYTMQLGSGTFDFKPSVTYLRSVRQAQFGLQVLSTVRTGYNDRDYRLGSRFQFTSFASVRVTPWLEPSFKIRYIDWGRIHGADAALDPTVAPVADAELYGGDRTEVVFGLTYFPGGDRSRDSSIDVQLSQPIHECINGPQPGLEYQVSIAGQIRF